MFGVNGRMWNLVFVNPRDPLLMRTNGSYTIGMTDANTNTIYIDNTISGNLLRKVLTHELCHCYCISYNIYLPIQYEEVLCEAIAIYGSSILNLANSICDNLCKYYNKC